VLAGLRVKSDIVGAGRRELGGDPIDRLDHQMDIDGSIDPVAPQRPAHGGTEGEVRDIVVVHDIEVYPVGARAQHLRHLLAEARQIGRENGRGVV